MATQSARPSPARATTLLTAAIALLLWTSEIEAAPAIRSNDDNPVPRCVTPERLMAFLTERNTQLDPRFQNIARLYRYYGEGWRVRWDYAFFQMAIETNFLRFRRGDGQRGDVRETQNNFAGIGATGGGVHGERFPDVATGVHAQIQHLVAYSGEHLAAPIARRTRDRQNDIIEESQRLGRPVTFADLARRWAVDRAYGRSIDYIADLYRARFCAAPPARAAEDFSVPAPQPARRERKWPFPPPSGLGGPKPDKLAGPEPEADAAAAGEQLPWLVAPAQKPALIAPSVKPAKKQSAKARSKVKTIWSRDGGKNDGARKVGSQIPAVPASDPTWGNITVVRPNAPERSATSGEPWVDTPGSGSASPLSQTDPQNATPQDGAASEAEQAPMLPTFRIAPLAAAPSRLGGPLPEDLGPTVTATQPPAGHTSGTCDVLSASYGGSKTLLIRANVGGVTQFTALTVIDGFEKSMFDAYARAEAPGAEIVGAYGSRDAALADARVNCPGD